MREMGILRELLILGTILKIRWIPSLGGPVHCIQRKLMLDT